MKMVHITIHTAKMAESLDFYQNVLGMEVKAKFPGLGGLPIAFLESDDSDVQIELIEDPQAAFQGTGLSVGFRVKNVEDTRVWMQNRGLNPSAMVCPNPCTRFFFIQDPNGLRIQII